MMIEECSEPTVEVSDIEMIEVSNTTEVISMIELPEKTKNTDTTENKAVSSEIVTSITISEQHDDSKEIKVLEQQPTSEVKPAAFTNVCITSYDDYLERLKEGYALQDIKLGHNKAVKVATFLSNKRMVIKEGKEYKINPDSHY